MLKNFINFFATKQGLEESQMLTVPKRLLVLVESLQKLDALLLINNLESAQLGNGVQCLFNISTA
jgi:hypothetical protein